ncbi:MAG: tRNA adenosine(34) deaminase TadA [Gammaproteobacteria bacterium]
MSISMNGQNDAEHQWMRYALTLAERAQAAGEVPVGAVIILGEDIIGEGFNTCIGASDPTAHAEIVAIRHAGSQLGNYRMLDTCLYTTLEPCAMCAGAIVQARIGRVVIGARDQRWSAGGSVPNVLDNSAFNHRAVVQIGVEADACARLLKDFFRVRRPTSTLA